MDMQIGIFSVALPHPPINIILGEAPIPKYKKIIIGNIKINLYNTDCRQYSINAYLYTPLGVYIPIHTYFDVCTFVQKLNNV